MPVSLKKLPAHAGNFGQAKAAGFSQLHGMFDDDNFIQTASYIRNLAKKHGVPGRASAASAGLARTLQGYQHGGGMSEEDKLAQVKMQQKIDEQAKQIDDLQGRLDELSTPVEQPATVDDELPEGW